MLETFPEPYPDELWYSVVARAHYIMGSPAHAAFCRLMYDRKGGFPGIFFPNNFNLVQSRLPLAHSLCDMSIPKEMGLIGFFGMSGIDSKLKLRKMHEATYLFSCPGCREEDLEKFGETFWHRSHQIPNAICLKHQRRLEQAEEPAAISLESCRTIKPSYLIPQQATFIDVGQSIEFDHLVPFTEVAIQSLSCEKTPHVATSIYAACQLNGYTNQSHLRCEKLFEGLVARFSSETLSVLYRFDFPREKAIKHLREQIRGRENNPFTWVMLLNYFGLTMASRLMPEPVRRKDARIRNTTLKVREQRKVFKKTFNKHPGVSIEEFKRLEPEAFNASMALDRKWTLHAFERRQARMDATKESLAKDDQLSADYVQEGAGLILVLDGKPQKVTYSAIMNILPADKRRIVLRCRHMPLTLQALDRFVDDDISHAKRRIAWGKANFPDEPLWQFSYRAGIRVALKKYPELLKYLSFVRTVSK